MLTQLTTKQIDSVVERWFNEKNTLDESLPAYVYFIRVKGTDKVKIGYCSGNPKNRLSTLQVGCPDELELVHKVNIHISLAKQAEDYFHKVFKQYCIQGEWFNLIDGRLKLIETYHEPKISRCNKHAVTRERALIHAIKSSRSDGYEQRTTTNADRIKSEIGEYLENIDLYLLDCTRFEFWELRDLLKDSLPPRSWRAVEDKFKSHRFFVDYIGEMKKKKFGI